MPNAAVPVPDVSFPGALTQLNAVSKSVAMLTRVVVVTSCSIYASAMLPKAAVPQLESGQ